MVRNKKRREARRGFSVHRLTLTLAGVPSLRANAWIFPSEAFLPRDAMLANAVYVVVVGLCSVSVACKIKFNLAVVSLSLVMCEFVFYVVYYVAILYCIVVPSV